MQALIKLIIIDHYVLSDLIQSALDKHVEQPFVLDVQFATPKIGTKNTETISNK